MKHIDSRILWLQDLIAAGGVRLKKIPRTQNLADMLTHTSSAKELEVFLPLMSLKSCSERDKELMAEEQYKPVRVGNAKVYSHGGRGVLNSIVYSSHARHVSSWLIVPASYDKIHSIGQEW